MHLLHESAKKISGAMDVEMLFNSITALVSVIPRYIGDLFEANQALLEKTENRDDVWSVCNKSYKDIEKLNQELIALNKAVYDIDIPFVTKDNIICSIISEVTRNASLSIEKIYDKRSIASLSAVDFIEQYKEYAEALDDQSDAKHICDLTNFLVTCVKHAEEELITPLLEHLSLLDPIQSKVAGSSAHTKIEIMKMHYGRIKTALDGIDRVMSRLDDPDVFIVRNMKESEHK